MFTDFKLWYIRRNDDGFITEAAVRFYEGDYQFIDGKEVYIRTRRLTLNDLTHLAKKNKIKFAKEINVADAIGYDADDFGQIKTDGELNVFLIKELAKDKTREPIAEQKWQP